MFFDIFKGKFGFKMSDDMGMDSDGDMMMRVGNNMAMDMDSGELHMVTGWDDDDNDHGFHSSWDDDHHNGFGSSWDDDDNNNGFGSSWDDNNNGFGSSWGDDDDW